MTITPTTLSESDFRGTFVAPMREITGREDAIQPDGVIDVTPYLRQLGPSQLGGLELLQDEPPAAVYASADNRWPDPRKLSQAECRV
jgi:hypothetical protein